VIMTKQGEKVVSIKDLEDLVGGNLWKP
jgi:hypothetical protein